MHRTFIDSVGWACGAWAIILGSIFALSCVLCLVEWVIRRLKPELAERLFKNEE